MKNPFKIKITLKGIISNAVTILFILLIKASVFGNFLVPTGSMNPTILEGDKIFSNNIAYGLRIPMTEYYLARWKVPQRGDIIAFDPPPQTKSKESFAKRVIAIPGDKIKIDGKNIIINGNKLTHKYLKESDDLLFYEENLNGVKYTIQVQKFNLSNNYHMEFHVPYNCIFVMGDNRDNSFDSRYWGFVPIDNVIGKLEFRYFSKERETGKIRLNKIGLLQ
jgi:signal peptidase I